MISVSLLVVIFYHRFVAVLNFQTQEVLLDFLFLCVWNACVCVCVCVHVCVWLCVSFSLFRFLSLLLSLPLPFLSHILTHIYRCGIVVCFSCQAKMLSSLCDPFWCYLTSVFFLFFFCVCVCGESEQVLNPVPCLSAAAKAQVDREDWECHPRIKRNEQDWQTRQHCMLTQTHTHTYTLNMHTEMYTGNYREVYQSAGISPCLNACEQPIPSLLARLYREGTGITPSYFHCIFFFFLLCLFPTPNLFCPLSLSHFSFLCLCVRARIALSGVRLFWLPGHSQIW